MKKEFNVIGKFKTVSGYIVLNTKSEVKTGTNNITHDDYINLQKLYTITSFVDGKVYDTIEMTNENEVLRMIEYYEQKLKDHLEFLANKSGGVMSLNDSLNERGYK
jgi:hypothetical protein